MGSEQQLPAAKSSFCHLSIYPAIRHFWNLSPYNDIIWTATLAHVIITKTVRWSKRNCVVVFLPILFLWGKAVTKSKEIEFLLHCRFFSAFSQILDLFLWNTGCFHLFGASKNPSNERIWEREITCVELFIVLVYTEAVTCDEGSQRDSLISRGHKPERLGATELPHAVPVSVKSKYQHTLSTSFILPGSLFFWYLNASNLE